MNIGRRIESAPRIPTAPTETTPAAVFDIEGLRDRLGELTEPDAVLGGRALELATKEALGGETGSADSGRQKLNDFLRRSSEEVVKGVETQLH